MQGFMGAVTDRGNKLFDEMREKTKLSRDAQDFSNEVDKLLADPAFREKPESATATISTELRDFMIKNGIAIDGKSAKDFLTNSDGDPVLRLVGVQLKQVKSALDSFGARSTDIAQQGNLEIQKITTTYNFLVTGCNSLTTLTGDLNKAIYSKL
ncbi:hypothetical protein EOS_35785 [Caballeronia mineralivorans PML1(12)]|uniref:Secretion protein EspA n=2 Tax=Caballeronia mineralivorans TaxID=2010198 RepID=A0A0J1CM92_9BURK|nr:hypothetical protein EOS_35785 [Caballeronia mineralivorans PML1(12)]